MESLINHLARTYAEKLVNESTNISPACKGLAIKHNTEYLTQFLTRLSSEYDIVRKGEVPNPRDGEICSGWVARDRNGCLCCYLSEPRRSDMSGQWLSCDNVSDFVTVISRGQDLFPHITWEGKPRQVIMTISIREIKEGEE